MRIQWLVSAMSVELFIFVMRYGKNDVCQFLAYLYYPRETFSNYSSIIAFPAIPYASGVPCDRRCLRLRSSLCCLPSSPLPTSSNSVRVKVSQSRTTLSAWFSIGGKPTARSSKSPKQSSRSCN